VFVTDWVDKSYTLHGKGKLWRIRAAKPPREPSGSAAGPRLRVDDVARLPIEEQAKLLSHPRREVRVAAGEEIASSGKAAEAVLRTAIEGDDERASVQALWAALRRPDPWAKDLLGNAHYAKPFAAKTYATMAEAYRLAGRLGRERADRNAEHAMDNRYIAADFPLYVYRQVVTGIPTGSGLELPITPTGSTSKDVFVQSAMSSALARSKPFAARMVARELDGEAFGVLYATAARRSDHPNRLDVVPGMLRNDAPAVRRLALQWIGEDRLTQFAPNLPDALTAGEVTRDLLAAYLACQEKLTAPVPEPGKPPAERSGQQFAAEFLFDERHDLKLRKIALELVDPADPKLSAKKLVGLIEPMGLEAIKAVAWRDDADAQAALRRIAADGNQPTDARREAVVGLARSAAGSNETKAVLRELLFAGPHERRPDALGLDALRALRGTLGAEDARRLVDWLWEEARSDRVGGPPPVDEREWAEQILLAFKPNPDVLSKSDRQRLAKLVPPRPADTAGWQAAAKQGGDTDNGRRVFALATGGRCYVCHQADHRGGQVGPDLTGIGRAMDRAKIVESILEPSKEVAPLYVSTVVELKNGDTISGVGLPEPGANWVSLADASGKRHRINADDVVSRRPEKLSVMPEGLAESMTTAEFRDLVAYLEGRK
jgi:putative heme-binding domain-containing protein